MTFGSSTYRISAGNIVCTQEKLHLRVTPFSRLQHIPRPHTFEAPLHTVSTHKPTTRSIITHAAGSEAPSTAAPQLSSLELFPIINVNGYIQPNVPEGTEAAVFAIYDSEKELAYVGFSKDVRNSLRTVFSRRPERAYHFKAFYLPTLDQKQMLDIRTAWFAESNGPPPGNAIANERTQWQEPVASFSISERGKVAAAEDLVLQLLNKIKGRGCKEVFIADPETIAKGAVDFLPAAEMSAEDLEAQRAAAEKAAKSTRYCKTVIDGQEVPFEVFIQRDVKTNGGHMFDLLVTCQDKKTSHRVIIGKIYYEDQGLAPETVLEYLMGFLLTKKVPRQTEGMLLSSDFPINYFAASEVEQFFDDFAESFKASLGAAPGNFWRFNRIQDYGYKGGNETPEQISSQFQRGWTV